MFLYRNQEMVIEQDELIGLEKKKGQQRQKCVCQEVFQRFGVVSKGFLLVIFLVVYFVYIFSNGLYQFMWD